MAEGYLFKHSGTVFNRLYWTQSRESRKAGKRPYTTEAPPRIEDATPKLCFVNEHPTVPVTRELILRNQEISNSLLEPFVIRPFDGCSQPPILFASTINRQLFSQLEVLEKKSFVRTALGIGNSLQKLNRFWSHDDPVLPSRPSNGPNHVDYKSRD